RQRRPGPGARPPHPGAVVTGARRRHRRPAGPHRPAGARGARGRAAPPGRRPAAPRPAGGHVGRAGGGTVVARRRRPPPRPVRLASHLPAGAPPEEGDVATALLVGAFGQHNPGDEALLAAFRAELADHLLLVATADPAG